MERANGRQCSGAGDHRHRQFLIWNEANLLLR
jgi:hypothetical protein